MTTKKHPFVLVILDGFGYNSELNSSFNNKYNAIARANTPTWDELWHNNPHCLLACSGSDVGLPDNQMGNSEVGHMNIGAGRIIYQDLTKIDLSIESGEFFKNPVLLDLMTDTKTHPERNLHVCGLVSDGGVHSHLRHFFALFTLAKQHNITNLCLHAFLDGRDTAPSSALNYLTSLDNLLKKYNIGKIVSIIGRYYAMDRDNRTERTMLAYNLLTNQLQPDDTNCFIYDNITTAINTAYARGETDEFIKPTIISSNLSDHNEYNKYKIKNNDNLIFMNFRADRARQLCKQLNNNIKFNKFITLTQYEQNLPNITAAYKPQSHANMLGELISKNNLTQLRIAETEKYAHVTFFFNGGREEPYKNEDHVLIPSPKVSTYNLKPEMSAYELTEELCHRIESHHYDFIVCNYANPDMVGHTGDIHATIKAIEVIDQCLARIVKSIYKTNGQLFITADHGNAECMYDEQTMQPHTAHTSSLVPLLYVSNNITKTTITITQEHGSLIDIAPSILYLMGLKIPKEMTGKILFKLIN